MPWWRHTQRPAGSSPSSPWSGGQTPWSEDEELSCRPADCSWQQRHRFSSLPTQISWCLRETRWVVWGSPTWLSVLCITTLYFPLWFIHLIRLKYSSILSKVLQSSDQLRLRNTNLVMAMIQPRPGIFLKSSFRIILALWLGPPWWRPAQRKFQSVLRWEDLCHLRERFQKVIKLSIIITREVEKVKI